MNLVQRIERKLGLQSLSDFPDIRDAIDFAAASGFRAQELNLGNPNYLDQSRSKAQPAKVRAHSRARRIPLLIDSVDGLNFFLADWQHVKTNLAMTKNIIAGAGVVHYTFHLGMDMHYSYANDERRYTYELCPGHFAENLGRFRQDIAPKL